MFNSALVNLLRPLDPTDIASLRRFLNSPYFNTNPTVLRLFELLCPHHPKYDFPGFTKQKCFAKLFPHSEYQDGSMRNLMSKLSELIRQFLAVEKFNTSPALQDRMLLEQYSKYKLEKPFNDLYKKQKSRLENSSMLDRFQCLENYIGLDQFHRFPYTNVRLLDKKHMEQTVFNLDRFFVISKLVTQISLNSRLIVLKEKPPDSKFKSAVNDYISDFSGPKKNHLALLKQISELQLNPDKTELTKAIDRFQKLHHHFSGPDNMVIHKTLAYLMNQIFKKRDSSYLKKMHKFHRFGIENNILLYDKSVTSIGFINIVTCGAQSGHVAWALRFVEEYKSFLLPTDREEVEILARSIIHYEKGEYDLIHFTLAKVQLRNSKLSFVFRMLMIKTAIERALKSKKNISAGLTLLNSNEKYFRRLGKKQPGISQLFINFIRIARKMLQDIKKEGKPKSIALKKMIQSDTPIAARYWLLQKLRAFK